MSCVSSRLAGGSGSGSGDGDGEGEGECEDKHERRKERAKKAQHASAEGGVRAGAKLRLASERAAACGLLEDRPGPLLRLGGRGGAGGLMAKSLGQTRLRAQSSPRAPSQAPAVPRPRPREPRPRARPRLSPSRARQHVLSHTGAASRHPACAALRKRNGAHAAIFRRHKTAPRVWGRSSLTSRAQDSRGPARARTLCTGARITDVTDHDSHARAHPSSTSSGRVFRASDIGLRYLHPSSPNPASLLCA